MNINKRGFNGRVKKNSNMEVGPCQLTSRECLYYSQKGG